MRRLMWVAAFAGCHASPTPTPARAVQTPPPEGPYVVPADAQEPAFALAVGTRWSLPCKLDGVTPVASLDCRVDKATPLDGARLAHIQCSTIDPTIGDVTNLDPSESLIAMRGGIWSVADPGDRFRTAARGSAGDLVALARIHPMIATPPREDYWREPTPGDPYSGNLFWHMTHDGTWCERQMPAGLGGGEHFYVQCFDATGQLRGVALAKRESSRIALACGSLADMPTWIFER